MNFNDENFLIYLRQKYGYLYDVEIAVRKVQEGTGFGEVSMSFRITNNTVDKGSVFSTQEKMYVKRSKNRHI